MDLGIKGRRALIFGGSRSVGRAVAGALAAEGADVAVCARKEWAAQKVAAEAAENSGVRAAGYKINAWDETSTTSFMSHIIDDFGAMDILFGITRHPALEDRDVLPPGSWQSEFDRGFLRFKAATETLLPCMRDRQWGRILWMIPWPTTRTSAERQFYSVMRVAMSAWLESIATGLAMDNVTVNLLTPAPLSRTTDKTLAVRQVAAVAALLLSDPAEGIFGKTVDLGSGSDE